MTFAWVIEKHGCDRTCPIYWTGHFSPELEWSAPGEHVRACRFARFGDASAVAEYLSLHSPNKMPNDTHGVYEHGWDEVPCVHARSGIFSQPSVFAPDFDDPQRK